MASVHSSIAALGVVCCSWLAMVPWSTAGAATDVGAVAPPTELRAPSVDRTSDRSVTPQRYRPPVRATVIDPFRPPTTPYGPGNRGLEYATTPGQPVRAIGAGIVVFVGPVAGRLTVSLDHPDGLRSSVLGLTELVVRRGQLVVLGQVLGRAGPRLHLGVRREWEYLDPARLFDTPGPAHLVPSGVHGSGFGTTPRSR
jgi:murein DD-endopeptidase MepM/ murein hydrolase activator NlpD